MDRKTRVNVLYVWISILAIMGIQSWWDASKTVQVVPYSEFEQLLKDGKVADVAVLANQIQGELKQPLPDGKKAFVAIRVDPQIAALLAKYKVKFSGVIQTHIFHDLLSWVLPALFFVLIWMFFVRRLAEKQGLGGMMSIGKSKAKVYVEKDTRTSFSDVAGVDEAKEELKEIVEFLRRPADYGRLGARVPKGVLLIGPPGTGKTLLAKAVAGQAGVPFFSISGSEFVEMFVGIGAARVRDLFEQARATAPCIIFIDELDALGRARAPGGVMGGYDEKEQTLNQLLTELDGFDTRTGIVLLAATNRPEVLDPALLRAGRFDRQVLVDRPDRPGRVAILQLHIRKVQAASDVDLEKIAALTPGFTGADLENLVNEAALLATRRVGTSVTMADFDAAVERIVAGLEKKSRLLNPHERKVVAYHEMGHALVATALPGMDPVHKISIIPRGIGALGYTIQRPTDDRFLVSSAELRNRIAVLLGGRAAEQLVFGDVSTGAADDLSKATDIARSMVTRFGMSDKLGNATYEMVRPGFLGTAAFGGLGQHEYSEATAREIDCEVRVLVDTAFATATGLLSKYRSQLEAGAAQLLEREVLVREDILALRGLPTT
jgi:cell division protease FtsH